MLDVVRHGYLKISDFNLIVFDECHHAQKDHPMLMLMAKFKDCEERHHPRVIGLTGMLTAPSIKPMNVLADLLRLEGTFRATIITARGDSFTDVLMHSTCPTESVLSFESNPVQNSYKSIEDKVKRMLAVIKSWPLDETHERTIDRRYDKQPKIQKKFEKICKEFSFQLGNLGMRLESWTKRSIEIVNLSVHGIHF